ncbi:MAG: glyoxalase, partial [Rhodobacteraceae bacterium]|nr:glyoxalase [Paracoccaceae bacterium]
MDETIKADEFGRSLHGIGLNLLVRDVDGTYRPNPLLALLWP